MTQAMLKGENAVSQTLSHVAQGSEALLLLELLNGRKAPVLFVAQSDQEATSLLQGLSFFAKWVETRYFPAWDCLPYDRASPHHSLMAQRIDTLAALAQNPDMPRIVVTTANAILQYCMPQEAMREAVFICEKGKVLNPEKLTAFLQANGYRRAGKAMEPGEYAMRGNLIDIMVPGEGAGYRVDLFGQEIETIRLFDPMTQISSGEVSSFRLQPVSEVLLNEASIERFRRRYRELFGAVTKDDPLYEAVSHGQVWPGMEHWQPLFYEKLETLLDYLPKAITVIGTQSASAMEERWEAIEDYFNARKQAAAQRKFSDMVYHPLPPDMLYVMQPQWEEIAAQYPQALTSRHALPKEAGAVDMGFRGGRDFAALQRSQGLHPVEQLKEFATAKKAASKITLLCAYSEGSADRLAGMLREHGIALQRLPGWEERIKLIATLKEEAAVVGIAVFPLEHGFETQETALVTEQDLLGDRVVRVHRKKRRSEQFLAELAHFSPGDLVVHREHGIGKFEGLETITAGGSTRDCLKLIYAGGDKLFLPVENIELVSRYGSDEEGAELDKLGSSHWQSRKARLKERILLAAEALLKVAAERTIKPAAELTPATGLYQEFCARFPYMETEDQAQALEDVLSDLSSGKPTDRLICGDVGFGKTEVALRAAFVAATGADGKKQVAVVTPTTLLCRQHFRNFTKRFEGFPVTIRQLSRLASAKEAKETKEMLKDGRCDIVIGTHALLSKEIGFDNLGLLIVDEEQHFGVAQKEKLKALKADVHVLTLSATPIPRTMQMALAGVRELSLITTPPIDRLAVRTFVMPFDGMILREAILREKHRGGQVFYVTPRIQDMPDLERTIRELVPEIRIAVAHGQMAAGALDKVMNDFYDGKFDVLMSTSIIESGLDIPTANTIIVNRADMFGLAQLYQMRGRVGRSKLRAYAYFTLQHHRNLSHTALKRLEVMQTLDTLGAGFSVASHDMDIRGAGNLLGEEQSGHVKEVGIELYQQMLEEAVLAAKKRETPASAGEANGIQNDEGWSPQINLGISVMIPESYVGDLQLRLGLYRRAGELRSKEEVEVFAAELIDRFGPLPEEVAHLLAVIEMKALCLKAHVSEIDAGPKGMVISFHENRFPKPEKLLGYVGSAKAKAKVRPDQKVVFMREWNEEAEKLQDVRAILKTIAQLAE